MHDPVVDDPGDLAARGTQPFLQRVQLALARQSEGEMVELEHPVGGPAGRLRERRHVGDLEERDGLAGADLEEVVPHRPGHERGAEAHPEHTRIEADGGVHVGRDEREVVHTLPGGHIAEPGGVVGGQ